jgi:hypothetical protein
LAGLFEFIIDSKIGLWKRSFSFFGVSARKTWTESAFNRNPEGYVKEESGNGSLFPQGPRCGPMRGRYSTGDV